MSSFMQEIANKHNELFDNHKVTGVYSNDMASGYLFDGMDDSAHNVEQLDLQDYFDADAPEEDGLIIGGYSDATTEDKAYALNELITAMNEGL